jgi:cell division cycle protein 37
VRKLKEEPSDAKPATGAQNQPTYDMMMLSLVLSVWKEAGETLGLANDPKSDPAGITANNSGIDQTEAEAWAKALSARMEKHTDELVKRTEQAKKEIDDEEKEQKKKITSDDVKEGWSTSVSGFFKTFERGFFLSSGPSC